MNPPPKNPCARATRWSVGRARIARIDSRAEYPSGAAGGRYTEARVGQGAGHADEPGERDGRRAAETVGDQAAGKRRDARRGRPAGAQEPDDAAAHPARVGGSPEAELERRAERDADPEHEGDQHDDRGARDDEQRHERPGADATQERELPRRSRPELAREHAEQVGQEGRRRERGEPQRFEAATPRDRRKQRRDEGARDPVADRGNQVERQAARDRTQPFDRFAGRSSHPGTSEPPNAACEVSCRARRWARRRAGSRYAPGDRGSPVLEGRFGHRDASRSVAPGFAALIE